MIAAGTWAAPEPHKVAAVTDPTTETRATYDQIATTFHEKTRRHYPYLDTHVAWFIDGLRAGAHVADIGCGPGRDCAALRAIGFTVTGFDLSAAQLRAGGLTGLVQADMRALPVRNSTMDGVWCQAALLHLPRDLAPLALAEMARAARSGGPLLLTVAEGDFEGFQNTEKYDNPDLRRWFTYHREPDLRALVTDAGFVVDSTHRHVTNRDWLTVRARRASRG
jgi:SAM-dependent methyltransferase